MKLSTPDERNIDRRGEERNSPPDPDALLSTEQAAARLGMSRSWMYGSDVPFVRIGTRRLYEPKVIADYRAQHRVQHGERS